MLHLYLPAYHLASTKATLANTVGIQNTDRHDTDISTVTPASKRQEAKPARQAQILN